MLKFLRKKAENLKLQHGPETQCKLKQLRANDIISLR